MKPQREEMERRIERAMVRLSRDRYLSHMEVTATVRRLADCAQKKCEGRIRARYCLPPGTEFYGMLRGKPPCNPLYQGSGLLMSNLKRICRHKNRKARAEMEILRFHLKEGDYKCLKNL
jgi:hypothetical protein